jgi:hypothetical protein
MTSMLFIGTGSVSNTKLASAGEYDPWKDINDDGVIEMMDFFELSQIYMTSGTPINKTELLLELEARIDSLNATNLELQSRVDLLNASILESQSRIDDLNASLTSQINVLMTQMTTMNTTISELRTDITVLNMTKLGKPDYDSGWTDISQGQTITFNHGLGTQDVLVYMIGNSSYSGGYNAVNHIFYGLGEYAGSIYGAYWSSLTSTSINVFRGYNDYNWGQIRVMLWKIPQP